MAVVSWLDIDSTSGLSGLPGLPDPSELRDLVIDASLRSIL
ncbi:MAG: hypothetical protein O7B23_13865 [Deltaproteobacteria bacterium]|nr:hypothetical protein [Deltaproteobacteria bacterium]